LSKLAKELNVVIIASLFEKRAQGIYHNTTAVLDADGSYLGKYRKMHIPMILLTMKNSILLLVTLGIKFSKQNMQLLVC
jgi:predicted amidohydrolase